MKHIKQLANTLILVLLLHATSAMAKPLPPELIGRHFGAIGQLGQAAKDGELYFYEGGSLGGVEIKEDGELIVPFADKEGAFKKLAFNFNDYKWGTPEVWHPLQDGKDRYSVTLFRYGAVFQILVKLHRKDGSVAAFQWICAEPRKAEQGGADQPTTVPDAKSEDKEKAKPESKGRPQ
jgi:hypothetical protein